MNTLLRWTLIILLRTAQVVTFPIWGPLLLALKIHNFIARGVWGFSPYIGWLFSSGFWLGYLYVYPDLLYDRLLAVCYKLAEMEMWYTLAFWENYVMRYLDFRFLGANQAGEYYSWCAFIGFLVIVPMVAGITAAQRNSAE